MLKKNKKYQKTLYTSLKILKTINNKKNKQNIYVICLSFTGASATTTGTL